MSALKPEETERKYRVIVVDPPWNLSMVGKSSARNHRPDDLPYRTMTIDEITKTPVGRFSAEQCVLFLWSINSRCKARNKPFWWLALEVMEGWGFKYHTQLVWDKNTGICPFDHWRQCHEYVLVGYKGGWERPARGLMGKMNTVFHAGVMRHSAKPPLFYDLVKRHFHGPRLDMFARAGHDGFDAWGDEA